MSRIRSVHPGFFKDERLVACSFAARLLFIGLGVEADDKGTFEWKPVQIKMNVFPGDNVEIADLLEELLAADAIRQYEMGGRQYGAIRNFRKFQKPKTPNDTHPAPPDIRNYVCLTQDISETVEVERSPIPPNGEPFPQNGAKSFQMEDGGGKREREDGKKGSGGASAPLAFSGKVIKLKRVDFERWRKAYHAIPDLVAELTKADDFYSESPPKDGKWFFPVSRWLQKAHDEASKPRTMRDDENYRNVL